MHSLPKANRLSSHAIPDYSVDWRFLLPIDEHTRLLIISDEHVDYDHSIHELGMSADVIPPNQIDKISGTFGVIAAPLGFISNNFEVKKDQWIAGYQSLLRLLCPGGTFLVGMSNRWGFRKKTQILPPSSIFETQRALSRIGIKSIRFFGLLPEPRAPEYIFPLSGHALSFVLNHRYQHKIPRAILLLAKTPSANLILNFLPFYYVIAQVDVT